MKSEMNFEIKKSSGALFANLFQHVGTKERSGPDEPGACESAEIAVGTLFNPPVLRPL